MPDANAISSNEASPLLARGPKPPSGHRRFAYVASIASIASIGTLHIPQVHNKATIVNLLGLVIVLASSAGGFLQLPQAQIIQDIICHEYYGKLHSLDAPMEEGLCTVEPVSAELAFILAITSALSAAVGLVATFPWSLTADRVGRKPVLSLALVGMTLASLWTTMILWFRTVSPIRLVWLESLGQLLGGGSPLFMGLLYSMVTDTTNEEERAVTFMRLHVAGLIGSLGAPTISSMMMQHYGPWLPMWIGIWFMATSAVVVLFVPETLQAKPAAPEPEPEPEPERAGSPGHRWRLSGVLALLKASVTLGHSPSLVLLLITCLVGQPVALSTSTFMPVFMTKRFGTRLLQGGYVQTAFGTAQMLVLFLLMPWASRALMTKRGLRGKRRRPRAPRVAAAAAAAAAGGGHGRDLVLARWSAGATLLAAGVLGLAQTAAAFLLGLALLALGAATASLVRSLLSVLIDRRHRSRLFGLVGMAEIVGQIYAQPMLAELFVLGMRRGGTWVGLPYFGLAGLMAVVTGLLLFVRVPHTAEEPEPAEEDANS